MIVNRVLKDNIKKEKARKEVERIWTNEEENMLRQIKRNSEECKTSSHSSEVQENTHFIRSRKLMESTL